MVVIGEMEKVTSSACFNQRCVSLMLIVNFVTIELNCLQREC